MKFTEGYWLRSENMAPSYASQGFYAEETETGMRIVAPERKILSRGDAQNITTITIDFIAFAENNILVKARHYEAYEDREARFDLNGQKVPFRVQITEDEALLTSGAVTVRVNRQGNHGMRVPQSGLYPLGETAEHDVPEGELSL